MAWDTAARRHIDLVGRTDDGDKVVAHEFDWSLEKQVGGARSAGRSFAGG